MEVYEYTMKHGENFICSSVEVTETPKMYKAKWGTTGFPSGRSRINKSIEGQIYDESLSSPSVFFVERNDEKAAQLFRNFYQAKIDYLKMDINEYKNIMSMIDKGCTEIK